MAVLLLCVVVAALVLPYLVTAQRNANVYAPDTRRHARRRRRLAAEAVDPGHAERLEVTADRLESEADSLWKWPFQEASRALPPGDGR